MWLQRSATSRAALRGSSSARRMTVGASAAPPSQNATVRTPTSRPWRTACCRSRTPGPLKTGNLRSQVSSRLSQRSSLAVRGGCEVQGKVMGNSAWVLAQPRMVSVTSRRFSHRPSLKSFLFVLCARGHNACQTAGF